MLSKITTPLNIEISITMSQDWMMRLKSCLDQLSQFQPLKDVLPLMCEYVGGGDTLLCFSPSAKCYHLILPSASQLWGNHRARFRFQEICDWSFRAPIHYYGNKIFGQELYGSQFWIWNFAKEKVVKTKAPELLCFTPSRKQFAIAENRIAVVGKEELRVVRRVVKEFNLESEEWVASKEMTSSSNSVIFCVSSDGSLISAETTPCRWTGRPCFSVFHVRTLNLQSHVTSSKIIPWPYELATFRPGAMVPLSNGLVLLIGQSAIEPFLLYNPSSSSLSVVASGLCCSNPIESPNLISLPETDNKVLSLVVHSSKVSLFMAEMLITDIDTVSFGSWCSWELPFYHGEQVSLAAIPAELIFLS